VRAIWLHNEMAADRERTVAGRQPFRHSLGRVFAMYRAYDQLVSVSPALTELNRAELADYAPADRFRTLRNLPDAVNVGAEPDRAAQNDALDDAEDDAQDRGTDEAWRTALRTPGARRFVTVGRLSTEKNHARLVRAFAEVHAAAPDTQLYIVGGGPLASALRDQIAARGLEDSVFLTGPQEDPITIMRASDCFVLSSDYEGQPMVLIEAAQLGLPIVSTAFGSAEGALPGDAMHIVDRDDAALAGGMRAFLDGDVPPTTLDVAQYTAEVLAQFDALVPDPE
jgi:CDP-glycerol glycerophosphotransferase